MDSVKKTCSQPGCCKKHHSKGLCYEHYGASWRDANRERRAAKQREYYAANKAIKKELSKQWRLKNPERNRELQREWYRNNKDKRLAHKRKYLYGVTQAEYAEMISDQNACCAICCDQPEKLVVDHDHATGKVRSLLCSQCNTVLGMAKESIETLHNAIEYLERWQTK